MSDYSKRDELGRLAKGITPWNKGMKGLHIEGSEKGWFKKGHKWSEETQNKLLNNLREKILLKLNLEMNENLAYIVGLLKGDGWVSKKDKYYRFEFYTTEEILASNTFIAFKKLGLTPRNKKFKSLSPLSKKEVYKVIANSKVFCEWYNRLTVEKLGLLLDTKEK